MSAPKLPPDMREVLAASGLPWHIENGSSHLKLIVGDRFTTILPKSNRVRMMTNGAHRNAMAHIRRAIREQRS